MNTNLFIAYI